MRGQQAMEMACGCDEACAQWLGERGAIGGGGGGAGGAMGCPAAVVARSSLRQWLNQSKIDVLQ